MDSDEFPNLNIGLLGAIFEKYFAVPDVYYFFFSFHISTSSVRLFSYEGA